MIHFRKHSLFRIICIALSLLFCTFPLFSALASSPPEGENIPSQDTSDPGSEEDDVETETTADFTPEPDDEFENTEETQDWAETENAEDTEELENTPTSQDTSTTNFSDPTPEPAISPGQDPDLFQIPGQDTIQATSEIKQPVTGVPGSGTYVLSAIALIAIILSYKRLRNNK